MSPNATPALEHGTAAHGEAPAPQLAVTPKSVLKSSVIEEPVLASPFPSGVRFSLDTLRRDAPAGIITGLMAVPLSIGICLMSEFPIQVGLATVAAACIISFVAYLFRAGNHVGVPGVAAGLAPVLALGIHTFGMANMPWIIFMTATMQMLVWRYNLARYILKAVPPFLIEGLLAGVGLKIAMKFLPYTYESLSDSHEIFAADRLLVMFVSAVSLVAFLYLYKRFKDTSPGVPYIAVIAGSIWLAQVIKVPMLHVEPYTFHFKLPVPDWSSVSPQKHVEMVLFAAMLMLIDVIEQVMSNAAIEKIDPHGRKADSNNSLLAMWLGNLASSFFGGMTNLDGLAKSSTNRMAGAVTKMSALFTAVVIGIVLVWPSLLTWLPEFSLAVLMIFTGWKMIAGMYHVAHHGKYGFGLALFCGVLVFRLGIFEGLVIALVLHSFITSIIYKHEHVPTLEIIKKFIQIFVEPIHPHATHGIEVSHDPHSGGLRYSSSAVHAGLTKSIEGFIQGDWANGINSRNLLTTVSCYDARGMLWGTFAKELRSGHANIKPYFVHLFDLEHLRVIFDSGQTRSYNDIFIRSGSYRFTYTKKGKHVEVPARYSFVCKRERTGWFILEHHSSEFPA